MPHRSAVQLERNNDDAGPAFNHQSSIVNRPFRSPPVSDPTPPLQFPDFAPDGADRVDRPGRGRLTPDTRSTRTRDRPGNLSTHTMVNRNLLRQFDVTDDQTREHRRRSSTRKSPPGSTAKSRTSKPTRSSTAGSSTSSATTSSIDVGYKSEGVITLDEWNDEGADQVVAAQGRRHRPGPARGRRGRGRRHRPVLPQGEAAEGMGTRSSPSTRKATSSPAWSPARSRAACWSTSASTSSCPPARSTSAGRRTSATTSTRPSSARSSRSTRRGATSSSAAAS